MKRKLLAIIGILTLLMGPLPGSVFAAPASDQVIVPVPGPALDVNVVMVNDGAGGQTDPHVSGDWVSYTDNSVFDIRFQNLDLGVPSDRFIPRPDGYYYDSLSDISGNTIVFMRATDSGSQGIYLSQIDPFGDPGPVVGLSPSESALRRRSTIGGDTIAYEDRGYDASSSAQPEIALSSAMDSAAPAFRLTNDTIADQSPAVSPDSNAVVWVKCVSATACDIWRAERTNGAWGTPEQVTGADGNEALPDTDGPVTVYNSDAGGDIDIRWSVRGADGAYVESVLALPGVQRNPNIAGDLISFESSVSPGGQFDIWLYDLATNRLYQLTDTPVSESLSDITMNASNVVRLAWTQPKQIYPYDLDVYALSAVLPPLETDTTAPTITLTTPAEEAMYLLGQTVNADYACQDEADGSGLASCIGTVPNGSPIDTSSIGAKTFTVDAADSANNTASVTHTYHVIYNFAGFTSPVDNPSILNSAKAGQSIPLKWRLTDASGNPITNVAGVSMMAVSLSCPASPTTDAIEEYATSSSGLQNLGDGYYQWNWKSPTSYANSCKTLKLDLGEGAGNEHLALFQFRK